MINHPAIGGTPITVETRIFPTHRPVLSHLGPTQGRGQICRRLEIVRYIFESWEIYGGKKYGEKKKTWHEHGMNMVWTTENSWGNLWENDGCDHNILH